MRNIKKFDKFNEDVQSEPKSDPKSTEFVVKLLNSKIDEDILSKELESLGIRIEDKFSLKGKPVWIVEDKTSSDIWNFADLHNGSVEVSLSHSRKKSE